MRSSLLAATAAIALAGTMPAHATLDCNITVDGVSVGVCTTSNTGSISFSSSSASSLFSSISLTGDGSPNLPQPDLSSVTLDVSSSAGFTGTHILGVDLFQTNVSAPTGTTLESTATINGLINLPGPTTLSDFINGTASTLGATLRSSTFAATFTGAIGPFFDTLVSPLTADAHQFLITFTAPNQSANDTIQTQSVIAAIPEPGTWSIILGWLVGGAWLVRRRNRDRYDTPGVPVS